MKKVLAIVTVVVFAVSSVLPGVAAFAQEQGDTAAQAEYNQTICDALRGFAGTLADRGFTGAADFVNARADSLGCP